MYTTKPEIPPAAHSLTTPAVSVTSIVTYYKWSTNRKPEELEIISTTMPVVALRDEEGQTHAVVLVNGELTLAYKAEDGRSVEKGYKKGWNRLCLTSEVEQRCAELEADFRAMMLIRTKEDALQAVKDGRSRP